MIACEQLFGGASSAVLVFATPQNTVLSLIFVPLTYFGPGMFKSFVTLRTGNDWVHALAITPSPRVLVDTPLIVKALEPIFRLQAELDKAAVMSVVNPPTLQRIPTVPSGGTHSYIGKRLLVGLSRYSLTSG